MLSNIKLRKKTNRKIISKKLIYTAKDLVRLRFTNQINNEHFKFLCISGLFYIIEKNENNQRAIIPITILNYK